MPHGPSIPEVILPGAGDSGEASKVGMTWGGRIEADLMFGIGVDISNSVHGTCNGVVHLLIV